MGNGSEKDRSTRLRVLSETIVGLTIISPRFILERDGQLTITIPETVAASADDLAPALTSS